MSLRQTVEIARKVYNVHMTRINLPNQPKLRLSDLLKRRKSSLKQYITDHGISTFESLKESCNRLGVASPTEDEYLAIMPKVAVASHPQEGVVVIDPLPIIDEMTGRVIDFDAPATPGVVVLINKPSTDEEEETMPTSSTQKPLIKKMKGNKKQDEESD